MKKKIALIAIVIFTACYVISYNNNHAIAQQLSTGKKMKVETPAPYKTGMNATLVRYQGAHDANFSDWSICPSKEGLLSDTTIQETFQDCNVWPDEDDVTEGQIQYCQVKLLPLSFKDFF